MTSSRDDDALGWAGDDDPTLVSGSTTTPEPAEAPAAELPKGWAVTGSPGGYVDAPEGKAPLSSPALIGLGILGGVYLLYTIGWFIGAGRILTPTDDVVSEFMFTLGLWLAVAAPAVWFSVTFWLTRAHPRARFGWLLIGVILLVPLSFVSGPGVIA